MSGFSLQDIFREFNNHVFSIGDYAGAISGAVEELLSAPAAQLPIPLWGLVVTLSVCVLLAMTIMAVVYPDRGTSLEADLVKVRLWLSPAYYGQLLSAFWVYALAIVIYEVILWVLRVWQDTEAWQWAGENNFPKFIINIFFLLMFPLMIARARGIMPLLSKKLGGISEPADLIRERGYNQIKAGVIAFAWFVLLAYLLTTGVSALIQVLIVLRAVTWLIEGAGIVRYFLGWLASLFVKYVWAKLPPPVQLVFLTAVFLFVFLAVIVYAPAGGLKVIAVISTVVAGIGLLVLWAHNNGHIDLTP